MIATPTLSDDLIFEAISEAFGARCPDFEPDCYCCRAWAQYDRYRIPDLASGEAWVAPTHATEAMQNAAWIAMDTGGLDPMPAMREAYLKEKP